MKTVRIAVTLLTLGLMYGTSAHAQSTIDSASSSKRVDLRLKAIHDQKMAAQAYVKSAAVKTAATPTKPTDRSRMADFMTLSSKRTDLRLRTLKVGVNQAYAEWMASEHPQVGVPSNTRIATATK